jgi:FKBP12-rapamycin complex-associated protein
LNSANAGELQGAALTRLALQTLVSFDFGSARLLDFVRDHVTPYLDDSDVSVRRAAAAAAAAVLHRTASIAPGSRAAIHPQVGVFLGGLSIKMGEITR